jgi:hypothetical protein
MRLQCCRNGWWWIISGCISKNRQAADGRRQAKQFLAFAGKSHVILRIASCCRNHAIFNRNSLCDDLLIHCGNELFASNLQATFTFNPIEEQHGTF